MSLEPRCRLTGLPLTPVLDLGRQPLGNGFVRDTDQAEYWFDLACGFNEESRLFQLITQPSPELMFHEDYAFFSGTSRRMAEHFESLAASILDRGLLRSPSPFVVELGSNDGILLKHFARRGISHLGVEPSRDVALAAQEQGVDVMQRFFDADTARQIVAERGHADLVVAANVMCHIPDLAELTAGIDILLNADGILMFEDPYLADVIQLGSYDQIYDEHVFLFSAMSVERIFAPIGLELIDVEHLSTHGGSMRYTLGRAGRREATSAVSSVLEAEKAQGLHLTSTYLAFADRVAQSGRDLKASMVEAKGQGLTIAAYGATSKSTTLYNYAGIGPDLITYICDNTPGKIGAFSPGVHIPVLAEGTFREAPPDIAFLAAWNHEKEIVERYPEFRSAGGRWLTHVPDVHFLS